MPKENIRLKHTANLWEGSTRPTTHRGQNAALHYAEVIKGADWSPPFPPPPPPLLLGNKLLGSSMNKHRLTLHNKKVTGFTGATSVIFAHYTFYSHNKSVGFSSYHFYFMPHLLFWKFCGKEVWILPDESCALSISSFCLVPEMVYHVPPRGGTTCRHEMLTQCNPFCHHGNTKKRAR
jgi:hypothetical protein